MADITTQQFHCDLCDVYAPTQTELDVHVKGKRHVRAEQIAHQQAKNNFGIYVTGYPPNLNSNIIKQYFSQYGKIEKSFFSEKFCIIDFSDQYTVDMIVGDGNHWVQGYSLVVRHKINKAPLEPYVPPVKVEISETDILSKIKDEKFFNNAVRILISTLQSDFKKCMLNVERVGGEIFNHLRPQYPKCFVHIFGSNVTGLCFNNSDIDIYVSNLVYNDKFMVNTLYKVKAILQRSNQFTNLIVIPRAKIPILKCVHRETNIQVDLNCKSMLGYLNSLMLRFYLGLDYKVKHAILLIKYWAKVQKLTGSNHLLSNYSLALIFMFYLQHPPYYVPSVLDLQRNRGCDIIQDGWNGGIDDAVEHKDANLKKSNLIDIVKGFFDFYAKFDFETNIVCPFLGKTIKRTDFDTCVNEACFKLYKRNVVLAQTHSPLKTESTIVLQDPFEHNRNTTVGITPVIAKRIQHCCEIATKICEADDFVVQKLLEVIPELKVETTQVKPLIGNPSVVHEFVEFSIKKESCLKLTNIQPEILFEEVVKFIRMSFEEFFKFDMSEENSAHLGGKMRKKRAGQRNVHDVNRRVFTCKTKLNLWGKKRKDIEIKGLKIESFSSFKENELAITNELIKAGNDVKLDKELEFRLVLIVNKNPLKVDANMISNRVSSEKFTDFSQFVISHYTTWWKLYETTIKIGTAGTATVEPK